MIWWCPTGPTANGVKEKLRLHAVRVEKDAYYSFMACNEKQAHATPRRPRYFRYRPHVIIVGLRHHLDCGGGCGVNPPPPSPSPRFISKLPSTQHPRDCHRETQLKGPFSFWRCTRYYACVPRAHHLCSPCHRSTQTFFINNLILKNHQLFFIKKNTNV